MKRKNLINLILILIFFLGLGLMLYPSIANWWNSKTASQAITNYGTAAAGLSEEEITDEFEKADLYNKALKDISFPLVNYEEVEGYDDILNIEGTEVIGYISIPRINVELPIYHGMSESVLSTAAGHLQGTSFPVGGEGTHAVIAAHRGLPSASLFSNLDKLEEGDIFSVIVLDRELFYEVDQVRIVLPEETDDLVIEDGKDYVTLLTCTPHGVNSHRLLVRGHRTENGQAGLYALKNEAYELDSVIIAPLAAIPLFLILFAVILYRKHRKKQRKSASEYVQRKS